METKMRSVLARLSGLSCVVVMLCLGAWQCGWGPPWHFRESRAPWPDSTQVCSGVHASISNNAVWGRWRATEDLGNLCLPLQLFSSASWICLSARSDPKMFGSRVALTVSSYQRVMVTNQNSGLLSSGCRQRPSK